MALRVESGGQLARSLAPAEWRLIDPVRKALGPLDSGRGRIDRGVSVAQTAGERLARSPHDHEDLLVGLLRTEGPISDPVRCLDPVIRPNDDLGRVQFTRAKHRCHDGFDHTSADFREVGQVEIRSG